MNYKLIMQKLNNLINKKQVIICMVILCFILSITLVFFATKGINNVINDEHESALKLEKTESSNLINDEPKNESTEKTIEIMAKDTETGKILDDTLFGIYSDKNCKTLIETLKISEEKSVKSKKLESGQYWIKELDVPINYKIDNTVKQVTIENKAMQVEYQNMPVGFIQVTNLDSEKNVALSNTKFGIYGNENCSQLVQTIETNAKGTIMSQVLDAGEYYIKELETIKNYKISDEIKKVRIWKPGIVETVEYRNIPEGYIEISKIDQKTNELIKNSEFKIYQDESCKDEIDTVYTQADGKAKSKLLSAGTYYIKEVKADDYYEVDSSIKKVKISKAGEIEKVECKGLSYKGNITVVSKDKGTETPITSKDTVFALYEWSEKDKKWIKPIHIDKNQFNGLVSDNQGYKLKEETAGTKGTYKTGDLYWNKSNQGKYKVVEYSTPSGYTENKKWEQEIIITQNNTEEYYDVKNIEVKGTIRLKVLDSEINYKNKKENLAQGDGTLKGATYGIYAKENILRTDTQEILYQSGAIVDEKSTNDNGVITFDNLCLGKYYIQEIAPSTGYLADKRKYDVDLKQYYSENYYNKKDRTTANIVYLNKKKDELYDNPNGYILSKQTVIKQPVKIERLTTKVKKQNETVKVENAQFEIYLVSKLKVNQYCTYTEILNKYYDAKTKKYNLPKNALAMTYEKDKNGKAISTIGTKSSGEVISPKLAYGRYVVIEVSDKSKLKTKDKEKIEKDLSLPFFIEITENNKTPINKTVITDEHMKAYVEVKNSDSRTGKTIKKSGAKYLLYKITTSNKEIDGEVLSRDLVTQQTSIDDGILGTEENPYTTDENGKFITPQALDIGLYELVQVQAPEQYTLFGYEKYTNIGKFQDGYIYKGKIKNGIQKTIKFKIAKTSEYERDPSLVTETEDGKVKVGNKIIIEQYNSPQTGTLELNKVGEVLDSVVKDNGIKEFKYIEKGMQDVEFGIYAAEDILTNDNQIDENGARTKYYNKNQKIQDVKTDTYGKNFVDNLPIGQYYIKENETKNGFILSNEKRFFTITPENLDKDKLVDGEMQKTPIICAENEVEKDGEKQTSIKQTNQKQKIEIVIEHMDIEHPETKLQGAKLKLYAQDDIKNDNGDVIIEKDEFIAEATSNEEGKTQFNLDIPLGKYYIKEVNSAKGYATNGKNEILINAEYSPEDKEKIVVNKVIKNQKIKVNIKVVDEETRQKLVGTTIILKDENEEQIGEYKVAPNEEITVEGLEVGRNYFIEETQEKEKYNKDLIIHNIQSDVQEVQKNKTINGLIKFKVKDNENIQTVTMSNLSKVGNLQIESTGDVLKQITEENEIKKFNYETQRIDTAVFKLYAKEDIIHPDGKTGVIVKAGTKVAEGKTEKGILTIVKYSDEIIKLNKNQVSKILERGLPFGKYEIYEATVPKGYWHNGNRIEVQIKPSEDENPVSVIQTTVFNKRQMTNIGKFIPKLTVTNTTEKEIYQTGEETNFKILVRNAGTTDLKNVEIVGTTIEGEFDDNDLNLFGNIKKVNSKTIIVEELPIGKEVTLNYKCKITDNMKGKIQNIINVKAIPIIYSYEENKNVDKELDQIEEKAKETIYVQNEENAKIMISKKAVKSSYAIGEKAQYNIKVTNVGKMQLRNIVLEDDLPNGKFEKQEGITADKNVAVIGKLESGESITLKYEYIIPKTMEIESKIQNNVKAIAKATIVDIAKPENSKIEEVMDQDSEEITVIEEPIDENLGIKQIGKKVPETPIGLYANEDIKISGKVVIKKDELIDIAVTDSQGMARFEQDIPIGKYYIKELGKSSKKQIDSTKIKSNERDYKVKITNKNTEK